MSPLTILSLPADLALEVWTALCDAFGGVVAEGSGYGVKGSATIFGPESSGSAKLVLIRLGSVEVNAGQSAGEDDLVFAPPGVQLRVETVSHKSVELSLVSPDLTLADVEAIVERVTKDSASGL